MYNASVRLAHGTVGDTNDLVYTFTWTGAHPLGTNYVVGAHFQTGGTAAAAPIGVVSTNVTSSISFAVWIRPSISSVSNVLVDDIVYVYAMP